MGESSESFRRSAAEPSCIVAGLATAQRLVCSTRTFDPSFAAGEHQTRLTELLVLSMMQGLSEDPCFADQRGRRLAGGYLSSKRRRHGQLCKQYTPTGIVSENDRASDRLLSLLDGRSAGRLLPEAAAVSCLFWRLISRCACIPFDSHPATTDMGRNVLLTAHRPEDSRGRGSAGSAGCHCDLPFCLAGCHYCHLPFCLAAREAGDLSIVHAYCVQSQSSVFAFLLHTVSTSAVAAASEPDVVVAEPDVVQVVEAEPAQKEVVCCQSCPRFQSLPSTLPCCGRVASDLVAEADIKQVVRDDDSRGLIKVKANKVLVNIACWEVSGERSANCDL